MKVQRFMLRTTDYGDFRVLRPVPTEERQGDTLVIDPWGVLAPVREFAPSLAKFIPVVTGEVYSHALHGHARPLMQVLGPSPAALLRMTPIRECSLKRECILYAAKRCVPGKTLPECWVPEGVPEAARLAASTVTLAWAENRYVIVVEGAEFRV